MSATDLDYSKWYGCPPDKLDEFKQSVGERTKNPVQEWTCPCGCNVRVFFSREKNPLTDEHGVYFIASHAFDKRAIGIHIDNVEDFQAFLVDERIDSRDRQLYALWLAAGLRDALLAAIHDGS